MKIQHNIMAMNSYRNYTNNTKALSKNLEKLSSGYRINRAGDDAAGLAISEKMRAQITGLEAAQKNAKDGISLVQTAEGALTEVHSMLNRMVDLASQSANGTYDDSTDRANLQKEVDALRTEIDRVAQASNFNGKKLLDGSLNNTQSADLLLGTTKLSVTAGEDFGTGSVKVVGAAAAKGVAVTIAANGSTVEIALGATGGNTYSASEIQEAVRTAAQASINDGNDNAQTKALLSFTMTGDDVHIADGTTPTTGPVAMDAVIGRTGGLTLQIGDTSDTYNMLTVNVDSMRSAALGLDAIDIGEQKGAQAAIEVINNAIKDVSSTRGDLGAVQNRLDHTINNLSVMTENIQDAEANIRDVDVAKEMMAYTKNNILVQSAQAMLAQANQVPQGVLQLLQ